MLGPSESTCLGKSIIRLNKYIPFKKREVEILDEVPKTRNLLSFGKRLDSACVNCQVHNKVAEYLIDNQTRLIFFLILVFGVEEGLYKFSIIDPKSNRYKRCLYFRIDKKEVHRVKIKKLQVLLEKKNPVKEEFPEFEEIIQKEVDKLPYHPVIKRGIADKKFKEMYEL